MPARDLPPRPNLEQYRKQAKELLKSWKASDPKTMHKLADAQHQIAREHGFDSWKKFTDEIAKRNGRAEKAAIWQSAEDAVVAGNVATLERLFREHEKIFRSERPPSPWFPDYTQGDARAIIAREHFLETWDQFAEFAKALKDSESPIARFERAVDAVVSGDVPALERLLHDDPALIRRRSPRTHHSMLLHYVGANGVESWRQRTPKNAVEIARILLDAGAEIDATADMYNGGCTTLGLVATSIHPKVAGVLHELMDLLLARGAQIDARGAGGGANAGLMINSCLANGRPDGAEYLASRGAPVDLEAAAGIGRLDLVRSYFNADGTLKATATLAQMNAGFTWACEYGKTNVIDYLLDHGVNVDELTRPHKQTGLHWAAYGGHVDSVRALLKHKPKLDVRDASFDGTPLSWALHGWWERRDEPTQQKPYYTVVELLVGAGAPVDPAWLKKETIAADPRMVAALTGQT